MKIVRNGWLLLVLALPTENATARMRFWRALRSLGCASLRDGVYLLPCSESHRQALTELADAIAAAGGSATLLDVPGRDKAQGDFFRGLFDRRDDYAALAAQISSARKSLGRLSTPEINRLLRRLRRDHDALHAIDFFPTESSMRAQAAWSDFVATVDTVLAPDEPHGSDGAIRRLSRKDYQRRTWATRRNLWVDRVASAWLIRRFIDRKARFVWLEKPSACPKSALGFDFDGATFTHVGERVTFEVLSTSFGLDGDAALARLGELVRSLDVGGAPVAEAAGFEALLTSARDRLGDDDALLDEMTRTLDALYAFYSAPARMGQPGRKKARGRS